MKTHHTAFPLVELPMVLIAARRARIDGITSTRTATTPARVQDLTTHQLKAYCARCELLRLTDHEDYSKAKELLANREESK
jgi:hypothetical protein